MALGDVFRITLAGLIGTEPWNTTFGLVEGTGAGSGPNPVFDAAVHVANLIGGGALPGALSSSLTIIEVIASDVQPGTGGSQHAPVTGGVGSGDAQALPPQCAGVISWRTALRGPANRGRMYIPGLTEDMNENGFITAPGQDALSAFASVIFDEYVSDGTDYQLNVLSYVPDSSPRALRAAVPVTSFSIVNTVKTQRRRGVGVRIGRRSAP